METRRHNIHCQCQACQSCKGRQRAAKAQAAQQRAAAGQAAAGPEAPRPVQSTRPPAIGRSYLSAYIKDFKLAPAPQGAVVPLEQQRGEGGCVLAHGVMISPEDGFYMLLWEFGVAHAQGRADLRLGINQMGTTLSPGLKTGYDSGQQVTWLNKGDKLSLQLVGEDGQPELHGSAAQLTVLRMG